MSKTQFIGVIALLVALMVLMTGCGADPVTVAQQFQEAVNSQNVETALELLAENASLKVGENSSVTGKDQIANWLATQAELRFQFNGDPIPSESGVTIKNCSISSYQWIFYEVNPMSGTCEVALEGGLITNFAVQFDENSIAKLSEVPVVKRSDFIGVWSCAVTFNHETNTPVFHYLQFVDDGTVRWASSPDDLLSTPDPNHPGALLTWTYEDFVLTLQNQGLASEGFCQEQDVGTYLTTRTDDGGIRYKGIEDSCGLRRAYLECYAPSDWVPFVP